MKNRVELWLYFLGWAHKGFTFFSEMPRLQDVDELSEWGPQSKFCQHLTLDPQTYLKIMPQFPGAA